jgi:hypothetical protein
LAEVLRKNDLYRFVTNDIQPAHNTFNTLGKRLGSEGFVEVHKRFVLKAHSLGLLEPEIPDLPKHRKKGIILVADSTFLITCGSTKGEKDTVEHDIVLTQDIIFEFLSTGKKNPVLKLNY